MKFTLKAQLVFLCAGFLVILAIVVGASFLNSNQMMQQFDNVAQVQLPAVRSMTLADMMHDGLRSVVLASLVAAEGKDSQGLQEIAKEAEEKGNFRNEASDGDLHSSHPQNSGSCDRGGLSPSKRRAA